MKKATLIIALMLPVFCMAQTQTTAQDTTFHFNNREVIINEKNNEINISVFSKNEQGLTTQNEKIYEGIFSDNKEIERTYKSSFEITIPGIFKPKGRRTTTAHLSGSGPGNTYFTGELGEAFQQGFVNQANINIVQTAIPLWNSGLTFIGGFGAETSSLYMRPGLTIRNIDNVSTITPLNPDENYSKIKLTFGYAKVTLLLEGNIRLNHRFRLFINGGIVSKGLFMPELTGVKNGKRERITRNLNFNKGVTDAIFQIGINHVGISATYGLTPVFEKDMGPKGHQGSFGFWLYF